MLLSGYESEPSKKSILLITWGSSTITGLRNTWGVRFYFYYKTYLFEFQIWELINIIVIPELDLVLDVWVTHVVDHSFDECVIIEQLVEVSMDLWESLWVKLIDLFLHKLQIGLIFLSRNFRNGADVTLHQKKDIWEVSLRQKLLKYHSEQQDQKVFRFSDILSLNVRVLDI